ncbi:hypothetical protein TNCV_1004921 [Trichonephila clavipes]|nr:hypothetical protein TNCV_1004921 [Trichonephila clavipes]
MNAVGRGLYGASRCNTSDNVMFDPISVNPYAPMLTARSSKENIAPAGLWPDEVVSCWPHSSQATVQDK